MKGFLGFHQPKIKRWFSAPVPGIHCYWPVQDVIPKTCPGPPWIWFLTPVLRQARALICIYIAGPFLLLGTPSQSSSLLASLPVPGRPLQPQLDFKHLLPFQLNGSSPLSLFPNFNTVSVWPLTHLYHTTRALKAAQGAQDASHYTLPVSLSHWISHCKEPLLISSTLMVTQCWIIWRFQIIIQRLWLRSMAFGPKFYISVCANSWRTLHNHHNVMY